jgi:transcriptional regulator with XRE-family HTH domain
MKRKPPAKPRSQDEPSADSQPGPGGVLWRARQSKDMSREDLSRLTNISTQTIYRTETSRSKMTRSETHQILAKALGLTMADLYEEEAPAEVLELDEDPMRDPVLLAFLQTEIGKTCKPEEVKLLAEIPRRYGKARDPNSYVGLLSMIRSGFSNEEMSKAQKRREELEQRALAEGRTLVNR